MLRNYERYDYRVQLMRIFACFFVIGCHVRLDPVINGGLDKERLLLHGFYDDGVTVFFMIIGFFLPSVKEPFWKYAGKTFLRILMPVFFLISAVQMLAGWIVNDPSYPPVAAPQILSGFLRCLSGLNFMTGAAGSAVLGMTSHLWYIGSYLRIVLLLPLLRLVALDHPLSAKAGRWLLSVSIAGMLLNDMKALFPTALADAGVFLPLDVPAAYVVAGYLIYQKQRLFKNNLKCRSALLAGMIGVNVLRFLLQCLLFSRSLDNNYFYFWNTTVSFAFSVCFTGFFLTFPKEAGGQTPLRVLNYAGTKTYFIYLVHIAVYTFMYHRGVRDMVYSFTVCFSPSLIAKLGYDVIYPAAIFSACLLLAVCLDCIKGLLHLILKRYSNIIPSPR